MKLLAAIICGVLIFTGCAEASSEINAPDAWETKAADPAFARRAEAALKTAPEPEPGWQIGVVTARHKDRSAIAAITLDGAVYITAAWDCDDIRDWKLDEFDLLIGVGDLFTWAGEGRTTYDICPDGFKILRKGVA